MHAHALHPEEHGRFFPERLEVDIYAAVIIEHHHLPRAFREIDLIPVEEMDIAQEGDEEKGTEDGYAEQNFIHTGKDNWLV